MRSSTWRARDHRWTSLCRGRAAPEESGGLRWDWAGAGRSPPRRGLQHCETYRRSAHRYDCYVSSDASKLESKYPDQITLQDQAERMHAARHGKSGPQERSRKVAFTSSLLHFLKISFSKVSVVGASRLSLTSTVSPCCSITTVPSSVVQAWRPWRSSILYLECCISAGLDVVFPASSTFLYLAVSACA